MNIQERLSQINNEHYDDQSTITSDDISQLNDDYQSGEILAVADKVADWVRQKKYGKDVRGALAFWTVVLAKLTDTTRTNENQFELGIGNRQDQLEGRQTDIENQFKTVQQGATQDDEVKTARSSKVYGDFKVLDDRIENIEQLMSQSLPAGFSVTIQHNMDRIPAISAQYYEYAVGTEPSGLGKGPDKSFGGINYKNVPLIADTSDANKCVISMPKSYTLSGSPVQKPDGNWYLTDGYKTIQFILS
ncbi:hypothetical protein [Ligilactobacillus acidipiscis]|uniref:hypothetical protein n=1 Tax=Ligilactobacillus acidipiscis TaxID=89059 RepID=UPI0023F76CB6|nr:hypothetical protein [Ligilactobacillus acidipiscis]WEV56124.1 hypothetical protein OZX66_07660 [Ligilactobacillus acidipiscis]